MSANRSSRAALIPPIAEPAGQSALLVANRVSRRYRSAPGRRGYGAPNARCLWRRRTASLLGGVLAAGRRADRAPLVGPYPHSPPRPRSLLRCSGSSSARGFGSHVPRGTLPSHRDRRNVPGFPLAQSCLADVRQPIESGSADPADRGAGRAVRVAGGQPPEPPVPRRQGAEGSAHAVLGVSAVGNAVALLGGAQAAGTSRRSSAASRAYPHSLSRSIGR